MSNKIKSDKLSKVDLLSMAIGQVIGSGIMTMTGIAIGFTGRSVFIAYLVGGLITILSAVPQIYIGGTANFAGGQYSQIGFLCGKKLAGTYMYIQLATVFGGAMFVLSFSEYFLSLFPGANGKIVSIIVLTLICSLHIFGVKQAAKLQNIMCAILAIAIAMYIALGLGNLQPNYFDPEQFMTGGVSGLVLACIFLSFASGGATFVVNYSSEAENPTTDIPFAIIFATCAIVGVYALMAVVASGVLPVAEVAGKPLSVSAAAFMSGPVYMFFVVGGAMFALLTTLNFAIGCMAYPAIKACQDGWLPKFLAVRNKKYNSPHLIIACFYGICLIPILFDVDITTVANSTVILTVAIRLLIAIAAMQLPKKMPEIWARSRFNTSKTVLNAVSMTTVVLSVMSILILIVSTSTPEIIGNVTILVLSLGISFIVSKKVEMQTGYTEK